MFFFSFSFFFFSTDEFSLLLYKELFYRHLYERLHPSGEHRLNAWRTYVQLFTYFQSRKKRNEKERENNKK